MAPFACSANASAPGIVIIVVIMIIVVVVSEGTALVVVVISPMMDRVRITESHSLECSQQDHGA